IKGKNLFVSPQLTIFHLEDDKRHRQLFEGYACVFHSYSRNGQYNHLDNLKQVQARHKLIATFSSTQLGA
ncbi:hypothetical protein, partial [uncultured Nostoc sp.]|uniref:hypothetical protein n=1 Tax=uncultured Nostoc sp. TaxID=340711 RepID=UPI0035C9D179